MEQTRENLFAYLLTEITTKQKEIMASQAEMKVKLDSDQEEIKSKLDAYLEKIGPG
jgi:hypothetical protein